MALGRPHGAFDDGRSTWIRPRASEPCGTIFWLARAFIRADRGLRRS